MTFTNHKHRPTKPSANRRQGRDFAQIQTRPGQSVPSTLQLDACIFISDFSSLASHPSLLGPDEGSSTGGKPASLGPLRTPSEQPFPFVFLDLISCSARPGLFPANRCVRTGRQHVGDSTELVLCFVVLRRTFCPRLPLGLKRALSISLNPSSPFRRAPASFPVT